MSAPLIGLLGKKRSGKDTFAAHLTGEHAFTRFAFADAMKDALSRLDPIIGRPALPGNLAPSFDVRLRDALLTVGWEGAKEIPEVRRLLQEYGQSVRELDTDFWVRATMNQVARHPGPVVVTDVRYPNEADAVRTAGGILIRVVRDGLVSEDTHSSEVALDGYTPDGVAYNSGTIEDLHREAEGLLRAFGLR